jgi:hypothetical protein
MRTLPAIFFIVLSAASEVFAQVPERVRLDVFVGTGATSFRAYVPPLEPEGRVNIPSDGLAVVQPTLSVSVTPRVQTGIDLPFAIAFNPSAAYVGLRRARGGMGDVRLFATALAVAERRLTPSLQVVASGSMETATLAHLAAPSGMGGRVVVQKILHPRVRVAGSLGYADHLQEIARTTMAPLRTWGGLIELGVSRRSLMSVSIEEVTGGARRAGEGPDGIRDLQAGMTLTRYDKGRPRVSLVVNAFGLRRPDPFVMVGVRFALLSAGTPNW